MLTATKLAPSQEAVVEAMATEVGLRYRTLKDKGVKKINFSLLLTQVVKERGFAGHEIAVMCSLVSKERAKRWKTEKNRRRFLVSATGR